MQVIKRDGSKESVKFDKISSRINKLTYGLNQDFVKYQEVAQKVIFGVRDGITTEELDNLAAETAASMTINHPDYSILAGRIAISSLHKRIETTVSPKKKFSEIIDRLYNYKHPKTGENAGLIIKEVYEAIQANKNIIDEAIIYNRDYNFDYFGFKTLEKSYLLKVDGKVIETPQTMYMRVAMGIWWDNIDNALKTYELLSNGFFTHATPTLFNAGTVRPQLSSCFLLGTNDSIEGIFKTITDSALISKNAGGIGIHMSNIRAKSSYIRGTNGVSNGLIPFLKVFNETARAVDQGGGRRKGSFAIYMEPWHADIFEFLDLRKNHGKEEMRARDLFLAMWIPDLFMERVEKDEDWTLFCPNEAPGLSDVYDTTDNKAFTELYTSYEQKGIGRKVVKARSIFNKILESQIETGTPYMLYKDACNSKSNQKNLGTIKSSNLCSEIIEYSDDKEYAVCNLASIALSSFVEIPTGKVFSKDKTKRTVNYQKLYDVTYQVTINLNRVIDINYYPTPETKRSNLRHRPIGIGVQGMADMYAMLGIPFTSKEARDINKKVFETIYYAFLSASCELAKKDGHYETFKGSPASEGKLQYHLWGLNENDLSGMWDFKTLIEDIKKYGLRNSLGLTMMPTASTSQILGNNEAIEPFTSNVYKRNTLTGEYVVTNKHLIKDLIELGLWNENVKLKIITGGGSIQHIVEIPENIKEIYKTVWEIKQKDLIEMSADRGVFICQSQSFNMFMQDVTLQKLFSAHLYGWKKGLKTGMYYLRTQAASSAMQGLGIDTSKLKDSNQEKNEIIMSKEELVENMTPEQYKQWLTIQREKAMSGDDCEMCGS
jgi:ribonucleoside-diphosphate reductase alpha chain